MASDDLVEEATEVLRLAREDPRQAMSAATALRDRAARAGNPTAESMALRAMGLAARGLHQMPEALGYMRVAVNVAEGTSDVNLVAEARLSLAGVLMLAGATNEAMTTLDGTRAAGETAVLVASQRAMALGMLGRYDEACQAYGPVISGFHRLGDRAREARALGNRGLAYVYTGRFRQADADLTRAEEMMVQLGQLTEAATICQNRGFAAARKGDLPAALALLDQGERRCRELGVQPLGGALTRANALASAGLFADARRVADGMVAEFREGGDELYLAEGLLLLADVALLNDDPKASHVAAEEAARLFDHQQKPGWGSLARAAIAHAGLAAGLESAALADLASSSGRPPGRNAAGRPGHHGPLGGRAPVAGDGGCRNRDGRTGASRLEAPARHGCWAVGSLGSVGPRPPGPGRQARGHDGGGPGPGGGRGAAGQSQRERRSAPTSPFTPRGRPASACAWPSRGTGPPASGNGWSAIGPTACGPSRPGHHATKRWRRCWPSCEMWLNKSPPA